MKSDDTPVKVKQHKRNGKHVSFWMSDELWEKLDALAISSGQSRTKIWKALLENRPIPDKSFSRLCGELARIGGLIKSKVMAGRHGDAYDLGVEIVKVARELKKRQGNARCQ